MSSSASARAATSCPNSKRAATSCPKLGRRAQLHRYALPFAFVLAACGPDGGPHSSERARVEARDEALAERMEFSTQELEQQIDALEEEIAEESE